MRLRKASKHYDQNYTSLEDGSKEKEDGNENISYAYSKITAKLSRTTFFLSIIVFLLILECYEYPLIKILIPRSSEQNDGKKMQPHPSSSNEFLSQELRIDRSEHSEADIIGEAQEALPTFPIAFWEEISNKPLYYKNESCARFPNFYELEVNNVYWQIFHSTNRNFYLFGAYYDIRRSPSIRILGMTDSDKAEVKSYCQIWFKDFSETVIVETAQYYNILHAWWTGWWNKTEGYYYAYLITCPIPQEHKDRVPSFVSLVNNRCDNASNNFRIIFDKPEKKGGIGICVKMTEFYYTDQSTRLIEWIELMDLLGAEKIFFHVLHVHENITKVFKYYEQQGKLEYAPFTLPVARINEPASFQRLALYKEMYQYNLDEQISLNDCFYRNIYKYDYITAVDIDEVILPTKEKNWRDLLANSAKNALLRNGSLPAAFEAANVIFNDFCNDFPVRYKDIPPYMHILQHVMSRTIDALHNPKLFFDTDLVEAINNHGPQKCFGGHCPSYEFSMEEAKLQHYRSGEYVPGRFSCDELLEDAKNDTTVWRFKEQLINRTLATLYDMGFFAQN